MKHLNLILLLFVAADLDAQELADESTAADPITAEVFADDMVSPDIPEPDSPAAETPEPDIAIDAEALPQDGPLPEQPEPTLDQTVPVADETPRPPEQEATPGDTSVQLPPDASEEDELIYQFERYKELMFSGVYDEADSAAKRVVELALKVKGPESMDFAKALTNLAIVQHKTKQFESAQQNYTTAIEIIETTEDRLNENLVNPLRGLGTSQMEAGRPDLASDTFRRAIHVTHVNNGPHNLEQVEILEALAEVNLRMGSVDEARLIQDIIFSINEHEYDANSIDLIPALLRRAEWQHRTGLINDERTTLRRAVRIVETQLGNDDLMLIEPLMRLGKSFFYAGVQGSAAAMQNLRSTGEIYFKRAIRIAAENPESTWEMLVKTKLGLGDYYTIEGDEQKAHSVYADAWLFLSESDDRLEMRKEQLEQYVPLYERTIPAYVGGPLENAIKGQTAQALQGNITVTYTVSRRGRIASLKIIEAQPAEFAEMQRTVQREIRSRIYRPRHVEGQAVDTPDQFLIHRFYYRQADLDKLREGAGEPVEADQS